MLAGSCGGDSVGRRDRARVCRPPARARHHARHSAPPHGSPPPPNGGPPPCGTVGAPASKSSGGGGHGARREKAPASPRKVIPSGGRAQRGKVSRVAHGAAAPGSRRHATPPWDRRPPWCRSAELTGPMLRGGRRANKATLGMPESPSARWGLRSRRRRRSQGRRA